MLLEGISEVPQRGLKVAIRQSSKTSFQGGHMSGRDDSQIVTHFRVVLHFVCPPGRTQTTSGDEEEASKLARRHHAAASFRRSARPLPPEAGLAIIKPRLTDTKTCQACLKIHNREVFRPLPNYALPVCSFQVIKAFP